MGVLQDRVILVTGGGRGIGRATVEACAAAGARLLVNDRGTDPEGRGHDPGVAGGCVEALREGGAEAIASDLDVADPEAPEALVRQALEAFGRIDGLVCCAGFGSEALLSRVDDEILDRALDVHLRATIRLNRAVAQQLGVQREGGAIVNVAGHAGLFGARRQTLAAAASAGVIGFGRALSIELRRHDVRVNTLLPVARTRLTESLPMFQNIRDDSMTAAQVAPVAAFLLSPLSAEVHGEVIGVAGARVYAVSPRETTGVFFEDAAVTPTALAAEWGRITRG